MNLVAVILPFSDHGPRFSLFRIKSKGGLGLHAIDGVSPGNTPSADIKMILTRHDTGKHPCARVARLRMSVGHNPALRLTQALDEPCTCGAGESYMERSSIDKPLHTLLQGERASDEPGPQTGPA